MNLLLAPVPLLYRWLMLAGFAAALLGFAYLKGHEAGSAAGKKFEADTAALAKVQAVQVAKINQQQLDNLTGAKHELEVKNQEAADNAVRNYILAHARWMPGGRTGQDTVPGQTSGQQGNDGTSREPMASQAKPAADGQHVDGATISTTCKPDDAFIQSCARDAGRLDTWQHWAVNNGIPIQ